MKAFMLGDSSQYTFDLKLNIITADPQSTYMYNQEPLRNEAIVNYSNRYIKKYQAT